MTDNCVVVTNRTHARFFTLEPADFPELESGPKLIERWELFNPKGRMRNQQLYTDSKTGRGRAPHRGPAHGYDDHRSHHEDEFGRRFARKIMEKTRRSAKVHKVESVVIAAPEQMLKFIQQDIEILMKEGVEVQKIVKNIAKFSSREIHNHLSKEGVLPSRKGSRR